eukprot:gene9798-7013_t
MIVSVVSLAPSVLSSSGSVAVKNSSLVSGSGSTNAGDTKYIEQPKLVSDVVTLQVLYASTNGSTTHAPLPVFQVNLTLHSTSSSSSSSGSSNASTTCLEAQGLQPCGVPRIGIVWRALSVAVIVALNAGALYFIITKAVVRGLAWQTAYLKVCGWEWFTEVLILDVVDVTMLDFVVPQALRRRVFAGLWRLLATMRQELTINPHQVAVDSKHPRGEMTTSDEDVLAALVKQRPDLWEITDALW